jgi:hypothetical protein
MRLLIALLILTGCSSSGKYTMICTSEDEILFLDRIDATAEVDMSFTRNGRTIECSTVEIRFKEAPSVTDTPRQAPTPWEPHGKQFSQ